MSDVSCWWRRKTPSCSPDQLTTIIVAPSHGYYEIPDQPYNEVYPGIFISDKTTALCTGLLRRIGISHVLNAAWGRDAQLCLVNTSADYYRNAGIKFMGVPALDMSSFNMYPYFDQAADYINRALQQGGKVLVHCREGISRSATLVLAFLMIHRNMTAQEAVRTVRKHRQIIPNEGFLKQLCVLNEILLESRRQSMRNPFEYRSLRLST